MPPTLISILFDIIIVLLIWKIFKKVVGAVVIGAALLVILYLLGLV